MWETKVIEIRKRLKDSLEGLSFEQLNKKPSKDEWSVAQIILQDRKSVV